MYSCRVYMYESLTDAKMEVWGEGKIMVRHGEAGQSQPMPWTSTWRQGHMRSQGKEKHISGADINQDTRRWTLLPLLLPCNQYPHKINDNNAVTSLALGGGGGSCKVLVATVTKRQHQQPRQKKEKCCISVSHAQIQTSAEPAMSKKPHHGEDYIFEVLTIIQVSQVRGWGGGGVQKG